MPRLIDLDQTIYVPVIDESKGGVSYEMQMTVAEFFDRFCDGFQPEVVDAIPVEWLKARLNKCDMLGYEDPAHCYRLVLWAWENEQEAQDG